MSNLYKSTNIINTSVNTRVIDSNERINSKLEAIKEMMVSEDTPSDEFVAGLDAEMVEVLVEDSEENIRKAEARAKEKAAEMIHAAKLESDNIINSSQIKAKEIREQAAKDGYKDGHDKAMQELEKLRKVQEKELAKTKEDLQKEYEKLKAEIEPQLVDTLITVFSRVTYAMADTNKNTILHLVESVMRNTEISRDFLIKVSHEDYQFMINSKEKLYEHISQNVRLEICQDALLKRNQCIIESDAGVFDCSLDIQMENLIKELRVLSCLVD